jgi:nicotinamide riboside kinase
MGTRVDPGFIVCVTGTESTGKTTLATALARYFDAPLVPEIAREWLTPRTQRGEGGQPSEAYGPMDVLAIATAQEAAESSLLATGAPLIFADTDQVVMSVWWEVRYGGSHPAIVEALARRSPRAYLLLEPDVPWQPDPLRETAAGRELLHAYYRTRLMRDAFPFKAVSGLGDQRLQSALAAVASWIPSNHRKPD